MKLRDFASMTLGEFEAIATRMRKAADDIREAQALLNPQRVAVEPVPDDVLPLVDEDPAAAHRRRQFQPVDAPPSSSRSNKGGLTASERAEKERLLRGRVDPTLPEEMQDMENQ